MHKLQDLEISGKRVLMRVDYNVPMDEGRVVNDFRIRASLPSIQHCLDAGASVVLMSHMGRPKGQYDDDLSLDPISFDLEDLLDVEVHYSKDCVSKDAISLSQNMKPGEIHLLENLRFHSGETKNDSRFSSQLALHADIYVNDAFGTAHRSHASNVGVLPYMKTSASGFLMNKEWQYLSESLQKPKRPYTVILGGAKVSDKIEMINHLMKKANIILIGGAMAFSFLKAQGKNIGASYFEEASVQIAETILKNAEKRKVSIVLPVDTVAAHEMKIDSPWRVVNFDEIKDNEMGFDIGPETCMNFGMFLSQSKTIFWNGPLGVVEIPSFATGTQSIASLVNNLTSYEVTTIIGGGDTTSAIENMGFKNGFSHISTGGGASLKLISGKRLPAFEALEKSQ